MKVFDPVAVLALPAGAVVDRRVPKTLLIENGARTAADKRCIRDGVDEIRWLAVLKPTTVGVAEYRDVVREYLEIAILKLTLRSGARAVRLTELVHRAVPYPVLLIVVQGDALEISLAHKRWSQGEAGKTVVDGDVIGVRFVDGDADELTTAFCNILSLAGPHRATLHALYQAWVDGTQALQAARITGLFSVPASATGAASRAAVLREYRRLDARIADLRSAARQQTQVARHVELNLELRRLRTDRAAARARLSTEEIV